MVHIVRTRLRCGVASRLVILIQSICSASKRDPETDRKEIVENMRGIMIGDSNGNRTHEIEHTLSDFQNMFVNGCRTLFNLFVEE